MILPSKHMAPNRALISVSADVFELIDKRSTVSSVWNDFQEQQKSSLRYGEIPYDWFVLAIDLLFLIGVIEEKNGLLVRITKNAT